MHHFSEILYKEYSKIKSNERECLTTLAEKWQTEKPYDGKKVLLNCHIVRSTLIMIDLLLIAGAEICVTATDGLAVHKSILKKIKKAEIPYFEKGIIPEIMHTEHFDILLDCGAGLLNKIKPKIGTTELTHTDELLYENIGHPVITVDLMQTKAIETYYGTGDALVRVLRKTLPENDKYNKDYNIFTGHAQALEQYSEARDMLLQQANAIWFSPEKSYLIFGYGKVGKGIADALLNSAVKPENIIIIDKSQEACKRARNGKNFKAFLLNQENLAKIKEQIKSSFCVITSTGIRDAISTHFEKQDFPEHLLKINMGTHDEWGYKFACNEIMNNKKPANFLLETPISNIYLIPIIFAYLKAGEMLVSNYSEVIIPKNYSKGRYCLPREIDSQIIIAWQKSYKNPYIVSTLWQILDDPSVVFVDNLSGKNTASNNFANFFKKSYEEGGLTKETIDKINKIALLFD